MLSWLIDLNQLAKCVLVLAINYEPPLLILRLYLACEHPNPKLVFLKLAGCSLKSPPTAYA